VFPRTFYILYEVHLFFSVHCAHSLLTFILLPVIKLLLSKWS